MDNMKLPDEELEDLSEEMIGQDPEAMFDLWTLKSIQGRYGYADSPRDQRRDEISESEADFENYVLQFPIDDTIAECFAFASESENSRLTPRYISGGKRPPLTKYHKLKKKLGRKTNETPLISDDESKSSESKRSKKAGSVFGKRHKGRAAKKSVNFSDQSESDVVHDVMSDTRLEMPAFYANALPGSSVSNGTGKQFKKDNFYENRQTIEFSPLSRDTDYVNVMDEEEADDMTSVLASDETTLLKNLEDLTPDVATRLRDRHGNTLLHRSVLDGNATAVKVILEKFPDMVSDMNNDKMTAVEIASKTGELMCLKTILERNQRCKALGTSLINRLLTICAQYGQATCLDLLLTFIQNDPRTCRTLPGDARGNTAAHLAAKNGHLHCLQALVAAGYDVSSENVIGQLPLHLANQNRRHDCYEYLLALDICEGLLKNVKSQNHHYLRMSAQWSGIRSSLEQIKSYLQRYQALFAETRRSLSESKDSILDTLTNIHAEVKRMVSPAQGDRGQGVRDKLDELNGEIERLEDTFEFSPLSDLDSALTRLFDALDDVITSDVTSLQDDTTAMDPSFNETIKSTLCLILRTVHQEMEKENFNTSHHIRDILSTMSESNPPKETSYQKMDDPGNIRSLENRVEEQCQPNVKKQTRETDQQQNQNDTETVRAVPVMIRPDNLVANISKKDNRSSETLKNTEKSIFVQEKSKDSQISGAIKDTSNVPPTRKTGPGPEAVRANVLPKPRTSIRPKGSISAVPNPFPREQVSENEVKRNESKKPVTSWNSVSRDQTFSPVSPSDRIDRLILGTDMLESTSSSFLSSSNITESDSETVVSLDDVNSEQASNSVYTTTLTSITSGTLSAVTSDGTSEMTSRFGTSSGDSVRTDDVTSTSHSYWWDPSEVHVRHKQSHQHFRGNSSAESDDVDFGYVHLNLESERFSDQDLRRERLQNHLKSVEKIHIRSNQFAERITTRTGETLGGIQTSPGRSDRIVVDVNGALRARGVTRPAVKPRKKSKLKLFSMEDATTTKEMSMARFLESYDRSRDPDMSSLNMRWEDMYFSDDEEAQEGKPWYEMSDDELSFVTSLRSEEGEDTDGSRTICSV